MPHYRRIGRCNHCVRSHVCKGGVVLNDATCGKVKSCLDCPFPDVPYECLEYVALPANCGAKAGVRVVLDEKTLEPLPRYQLGQGFEWSATYNKSRDRLSVIIYHKSQFIATIDIGDTHTEVSVSTSVKIPPMVSLQRYVSMTAAVLFASYGLYSLLLSLVRPGHLLKYTKGQMSIQEFHGICDDLYSEGAVYIA
nr:MAG TPA: hypothetical protein [Caudoviricetes sp.]